MKNVVWFTLKTGVFNVNKGILLSQGSFCVTNNDFTLSFMRIKSVLAHSFLRKKCITWAL